MSQPLLRPAENLLVLEKKSDGHKRYQLLPGDKTKHPVACPGPAPQRSYDHGGVQYDAKHIL